jgi:hypothetical protein
LPDELGPLADPRRGTGCCPRRRWLSEFRLVQRLASRRRAFGLHPRARPEHQVLHQQRVDQQDGDGTRGLPDQDADRDAECASRAWVALRGRTDALLNSFAPLMLTACAVAAVGFRPVCGGGPTGTAVSPVPVMASVVAAARLAALWWAFRVSHG